MDLGFIVPVTLFLCITYAIKAVVDAWMRRRIIESHGSEELLRSLLEGDEVRRRQGALRWGSILTLLAVGFGLIEAFGWRDVTPGAIAILLGATGLGNLIYFALGRRLK
ncbi:MAG: hypothetical protein QM599_07770 [Pseudoxanthomonas sp.]